MIHLFSTNISDIPVPKQFTYPFHYTPHPLCLKAVNEIQSYLKTRSDWQEELQDGKMFGVLIVRNKEGIIGFIAAFSGILAGSNNHDYFVPPIYDLLNPNGYFRQEEYEISQINQQIQEYLLSADNIKAQKKLSDLEIEAEISIHCAKENYKIAKVLREERRKGKNTTPNELIELTKESQFQKAELKRLKQSWDEKIKHQRIHIEKILQFINDLKEERKSRSASLQQWIFQQFRVLNALGEEKNLCELFATTPQLTPPSGSGECAAPKLLQYAYQHQLVPIAMAEFWWGNSPKGEIRNHGYFYPACKQKCEPILKHMLQGLNVEPNPLLDKATPENLNIIYEDEYIIIVNKPSGMLSAPGKSSSNSVYSIIKEKRPYVTGPIIVHRLDMDTSGVLLVAKNKDVYIHLQKQFENHTIKKRYIALLTRVIAKDKNKGFIRLPLRPDYENRPLQMVDPILGKPAITRYEIIGQSSIEMNGTSQIFTRIAYYPETGRTHQLRVHSAHTDGLNSPILGDSLYGQAADRLYLHAEQLEFKHPVSGKIMRFKIEAPF